MDTIRVKGIDCRVNLGVSEAERNARQRVEVDVELSLDLEAAANTDELDLSVDYHDLTSKIQTTAGSRPYRLVEALANRLCQVAMADSKVQRAAVTVRKFPAEMKEAVHCVEVILTRSQ